jgi:hypothetical protein
MQAMPVLRAVKAQEDVGELSYVAEVALCEWIRPVVSGRKVDMKRDFQAGVEECDWAI